jgi:hypothetical protein
MDIYSFRRTIPTPFWSPLSRLCPLYCPLKRSWLIVHGTILQNPAICQFRRERFSDWHPSR